MKLLLRLLLGLVLALGVVFVAGGLLLPASAHVERSITIDRPPAEVFALLNSYQRYNEWSPWFELDPDARYTYSGSPSGAGAKMAWVSQEPGVGSGSQAIIESLPNRKVVTELDFGDQGKAVATFLITPEGSGSKVVWAFDSTPSDSLPARWLGSWFGLLLDKLVGPDFEKGLAKLKAVLENGSA